MKKIQTNLRAAQVSALAQNVLTIQKQVENPPDERLPGLFKTLEDLSANLTTAIKQDRVRSKLSELDKDRDKWLRVLYSILKGYQEFPIEEKSLAAKSLLPVFKKYGTKIADKNYREESAFIESLLNDLSAESLKEPINTLNGVPQAIEILRNAQNAFVTENRKYNTAIVNKGESATKLKGKLVDFFNAKLVPCLNAIEALSEEPQTFLLQIALEIDKANASLKKSTPKDAPQTTAEEADSEV